MRRFRREVLIWLGWSVPAVFLGALSYVEAHRLNVRMVAANSLPWYYWALFTTSIVQHAYRHPPDTLRRARGVLRHLGVGVGLGAVCGFISALAYIAIGVLTEGRSIAHHFISNILFWCFFGLVFYSLITAVGFVIGAQKRLRERELLASQLEARLVEAQLHGLRMQLQPHFLFNTLNTIAMYVRDGDAATSIRVLTRLSELLRRVLDTSAAQEVPLSVELEQAMSYLEIETVRFSDRLQVTTNVASDVEQALVPNLSLQPLVENAIRHGIAKRGDAGTIKVEAKRRGDQLTLSVYNDGPPLPSDWKLESARGIGLSNTALRLHHLYGNLGRLSVTNANGGVVSEITLPYRTARGSNDG
jgi:two-component sensor histidine kinase